ncbi:GlgB N-terminal domain-containing protein, partial [Methylicorpusculum sp.]
MKKQSPPKLGTDFIKIIEAKHHDPFAVLGRHPHNDSVKITLYLPYAESVSFADTKIPIPRVPGTDFFEYIAKK